MKYSFLAKHNLAFIFFHLIWLLVCFSNGQIYAEESSNNSEKVDAVLVLDASGSMLLTDPNNLRQEGAKLFTQFLKKGDRLAIVSFSDSATVLSPLEDFDPANLSKINNIISSAVAKGEYTDLASGIDKAFSILQNQARKDASSAIVLMSDGKMEPPPNALSADLLITRLAEKTLPELKKNGIKLYTLAFSELADQDLLKEFALITDGISWFTPTSDKIHESFANLFLAVKKPQFVPQTKKGFKIDNDIQEATFYINREGSTEKILITRPDGSNFGADSTLDDVKWFKGQKFDVVTISFPSSGDWQISGVANQDGFATVLTKLRLVSEWPSNLYAQSKVLLEARLFEEDKPVSLPEMSETIQFAFQITPTDKISEPILRGLLNDEGKNGDRIARDGVFSQSLELEDPGEYKIRIVSKAPTFERNQQIPFRVKAPLVKVATVDLDEKIEKILTAEEDHHDSAGHSKKDSHASDSHDKHKGSDSIKVFEVTLNDDAAGFKKLSVKLIATDSEKVRYEIPLKIDPLNKTKFYASSTLLPKADEYQLIAKITGENKRGQNTKADSRPYKFIYHLHEGHTEDIQLIKPIEPPKPPKPASPLIPIILMTILNGLAVFGIYKFLSKKSENVSVEVPEFLSVTEAEELITALKAKIELKEVDLTIPYLNDPQISLPATWDEVESGLSANPKDNRDESSNNKPEADSNESSQTATETNTQESDSTKEEQTP